MKIAVLSLADINNYGDAFFPYVMRMELLKRLSNADIVLYTNTESHCRYYETKPYSYKVLSTFDAIILAGGETIHLWDEEKWENFYGENIKSGEISDIAFDWLTLNYPFKAYFSVGVHPNMIHHQKEIVQALQSLDYIAVRGALSKKIIEAEIISNFNQVRIVPDLGWLFSEYIKHDTHNNPYEPYMVFEMFYEFDEETICYAARELVKFQEETNVKVVLLPIVQTKSRQNLSSWNDYFVLSKIKEYSDGKLELLPDGMDIMEVGQILKSSKFYLGGSMHGAVTSLAYGHPAGNILTWTAPKLQDLHGARMRTDCFSNHWGNLPRMLRMLNREAEDKSSIQNNIQYANYMRYRLTMELDNLCEQIEKYRR